MIFLHLQISIHLDPDFLEPCATCKINNKLRLANRQSDSQDWIVQNSSLEGGKFNEFETITVAVVQCHYCHFIAMLASS